MSEQPPRTSPPAPAGGDPSHTPPPAPPPRAPRLDRIAGLIVRRRRRVLAAWVAALVLIAGGGSQLAGEWEADYATPGAESEQAAAILVERFGDAGSGGSIEVVWQAREGVAHGSVAPRIDAFLEEAAELEGIAGAGEVRTSPDGTIATSSLALDRREWDVPLASGEALIERAEEISDGRLQVELAGGVIAEAREAADPEVFGMVAALVILLLAFGSVLAAGLPLITALFGLGISMSLIGVLAQVLPIPDWSTAVAALIGIALGIDYSLLILTRFRAALRGGNDVRAALAEALATAGRSVLVAGITVIVALAGLILMRLSFMTGVAFSAMLAVLVAMSAALTLVPALLAFAGHRVDRLRLPGLGRGANGESGPVAARWARAVQRRPLPAAAVGVGVLLALAAPVRDMRLGFPDFGSDPEGTTTRNAHELLAEGFGPGASGPLLVAAELDPASPGARRAMVSAAERLEATEGVAAVSGPQLSPSGDAALITVTPVHSPQHEATEELVHGLRDEVLPQALADTGIVAHIGGLTASFIDQSDLMAARMPLFIAGVLAISLLLLLVAFRAPVIAVKAGILNLLSVGAAYGVVALASQGGWLGQLIGIDTEVPVAPFIPVMMFAILFGLSMDYEVFLLSRVREEYLRHRDTARAVSEGLAKTARVITAAAAIMVAVFSGFLFSSEVFLKQMGLGMAAAIAIDATIVRMVLVPSVMQLLGRANWWLPAWLDRLLPNVDLEREAPHAADPSSEPVEERVLIHRG
jgi:putative drug exporter of the RND superfamily